MEKVCKAFLSADITLYKLNNKYIKNLFHDIDIESATVKTKPDKPHFLLLVDRLRLLLQDGEAG